MGIIKKIRKIFFRFRGQGDNWQDNLRYNAPRLARTALGDIVFFIVAVVLAVMFLVSGIFEFIFRSPLSSAVGGAAKSVLETTPNQVGAIISGVPGSDLGQTSIGGMLQGLLAGIAPLFSALFGLLDDIIGILMVVAALIIRFSHRLLSLLIGGRPASEKGARLSWIALGIAFAYFLLTVFVW